MGKFDGVIIVSDIDGTFLGKHARLVPRNLEAIEYFKKEGGCFTIATGREHFLVYRPIPNLKEVINIPLIACNGAYIYDAHAEKVVLEEFLPEPEISRIVDAARAFSPGSGLRITCDMHYYIDQPFEPVLRDFVNYQERIRVVPYDETPHGRWHKIAWDGDVDELLRLRPVIDGCIKGGCVSMLSCPTILEVQSANATKGMMLSRLKKLIGRESATLWAIGDYENDLAMLQMADRCAMPSNGIDSLRAVPGMVEVCNHDEGAIAGLIEYIESHLEGMA